LLGPEQISTNIIEAGIPSVRAGHPADSDVEQIVRALSDAKRPVLYVGDGVWKSGAQKQATALAERFGLPVVSDMRDTRSVSIKHPLHSGRAEHSLEALDPDLIMCLGVRHNAAGNAQDFNALLKAQRIIAVGSDVVNLKNMPGLDLAVMADEGRTIDRILDSAPSEAESERFRDRRVRSREEAASLRAQRRKMVESINPESSRVRSWVLADALDKSLERRGGGLVMIEQYAVSIDTIGDSGEAGNNVYIWAAGGSEGYGIGASIGTKLAAPERPVVGLVGDGSMYYADSGLWTAAHHGVPLLYVIPNNEAYGVVAGFFGQAGGNMKQSGVYGGVVLDNIDPIKVAEGFGVEGMEVQDEATVEEAIDHGLDIVEREGRAFVLNVRLPRGLPQGGRAATPYNFKEAMPKGG
jgi:benzoylformate decarboxylase